MRCLWFWGDFGQPVSWSSGLCSFVSGEFAWYVLPWNLLALVWCLVSVSVWRHLRSSCQSMFLGVRSSLESGFGFKPPASSYWSYFYSSFKTSPFSPPGRLCLLPNPSLLYPTLWISVCSRRWRTLRELITGWICLPPFHSPLLSFWPPLSPSSIFSSLYNSVNISEQSSCGVHIRKWLLASPLSPLLIPPHLIWVTSNSLFPLLFSM